LCGPARKEAGQAPVRDGRQEGVHGNTARGRTRRLEKGDFRNVKGIFGDHKEGGTGQMSRGGKASVVVADALHAGPAIELQRRNGANENG
jgi:hypothetical protein